MMNPLKYSPEGLPWKDYRPLQFLAAAPLSYAAACWLEAMWRCSRRHARLVGAETLPDNAIIYDFHVDVCLNYITMHLLKELGKKVVFATSHDFNSYLAAGPGSFGAYQSWRFDRRQPAKPLEQIGEMLEGRPDSILGIFTDGAGGKPFRVRESLVKLAIASKRPLVPFRSLYSPTFRMLGDDYPKGLVVKGRSVFGAPIAFSDLAALDVETARSMLESALFAISDERLVE